MQGIQITRQVMASALTALAITLAAPQAHAAIDVVNTQVPTGTLLGSNTLDSGDWLAQKFTVSAATQIDSVMAYVLSSDAANDLGKTFTLALYANNASTNLPALNWFADQQGQLFQAQATYNGDGWNGLSNLGWTLSAGSYWLALEQSGGANEASSLQVPTGALPVAQAVAYYAGGQGYASTSASDTFGLHITAVTPAVPEPDGYLLAFTALGLIGLAARRMR